MEKEREWWWKECSSVWNSKRGEERFVLRFKWLMVVVCQVVKTGSRGGQPRSLFAVASQSGKARLGSSRNDVRGRARI